MGVCYLCLYICSMYKDRQVKELCYPEGVPELFQVITYIHHIYDV